MKKHNQLSYLIGATSLLLLGVAIGYKYYISLKPIEISNRIKLNITEEEYKKSATVGLFTTTYLATNSSQIKGYLFDLDTTIDFTISQYSNVVSEAKFQHVNCVASPVFDPETKRIVSQKLLIGATTSPLYIPLNEVDEKVPQGFDFRHYRSFQNFCSINYIQSLISFMFIQYGRPDSSSIVDYSIIVPKYESGYPRGKIMYDFSSRIINSSTGKLNFDEARGRIYYWKKKGYSITFFSGYQDFPSLERTQRVIYIPSMNTFSFLINPNANSDGKMGDEVAFYPFIEFKVTKN